MNNKIKIMVADDEKLIREGLKIILESYEDIEVVSLAENGMEAFERTREYKPELVLMDIRMPVLSGVKATKMIKDYDPNIKILILTTFSDAEYIREALSYGASGYLLKDSDYDLIHDGIKAALTGNIVINKDVAEKMLSQNSEKNNSKAIIEEYGLNDKELSLIQLIADGLNNKEISEKLFLSEGTIKNHITSLLNKLNFRDRLQLTAFAYKNNLVD